MGACYTVRCTSCDYNDSVETGTGFAGTHWFGLAQTTDLDEREARLIEALETFEIPEGHWPAIRGAVLRSDVQSVDFGNAALVCPICGDFRPGWTLAVYYRYAMAWVLPQACINGHVGMMPWSFAADEDPDFHACIRPRCPQCGQPTLTHDGGIVLFD
ncbi:MAG: hypothetical protein D6761_12435 [Candidatus Dadabacteria bacterium]|nr:MAG: hypothetical protein D6761_12435 [Candidatus Dadabacteria bacterium]